MTEVESYQQQIELNYLGYVKVSHPVAKRMAKRRTGKIIFTGSVLSYFAIAGYSAYCGSKYAVKGFADALEMELKPYGVSVHFFCPGTVDTPGYQEENKRKPEVTKRIEGTAGCLTATEAANVLMAGLNRGDYIITTELLFEFIQGASLGVCKRDNFFFNIMLAPLHVLTCYILYGIVWWETKQHRPFLDQDS